MCGIVGLLLRNQALRPSLGAMLTPMFASMAERGPDSAGLAIFGQPVAAPLRRYSLFALDRTLDWGRLASDFRRETEATATAKTIDNHAVWTTTLGPEAFDRWVSTRADDLLLLSTGRAVDLYKDMGDPNDISRRYGFAQLRGTHGIGHTRMATESVVSPAHAHPYTAGEDLCLVHNGSLSNPNFLRRLLESKGLRFATDNDTEAACRYVEWRLREGDTLEQAVSSGLSRLDGFYTLLVATADRMLLVRDAFACKPAVVAETDDYVAVASEFRSFASLPGIDGARIYEPQPEEICSWKL